ncbi:MAG: segregation/condensation protein A [Paracoccaceae bacterium]|nr:segregation/condensation protein A [Paracoccaceae bacterium]
MPENVLDAPVANQVAPLETDPFDTPPGDLPEVDGDALSVSVDGFEGPLDLLLMLARTQKVDLRKVSVLQLAEQYLEFVNKARALRLELAADYLVMAAWLAFLKSRLLLPPPHEDGGPSGEELAAHLAFQLERLEAMRRAAAQLMGRDQLGRDFFARGMTETVTVKRQTEWTANLADLLRAYSRVRTRDEFRPLQVDRSAIFTMDQALERLKHVIGMAMEWGDLASFLPDGWSLEPAKRRSAIASTFAASLELAKLGQVEIRQDKTFAPIYLRARQREETPA